MCLGAGERASLLPRQPNAPASRALFHMREIARRQARERGSNTLLVDKGVAGRNGACVALGTGLKVENQGMLALSRASNKVIPCLLPSSCSEAKKRETFASLREGKLGVGLRFLTWMDGAGGGQS